MKSASYLHVGVCSPLLEALWALVGLLPRVYSDMIPESGGPGEGLTTDVTSVRARTLGKRGVRRVLWRRGVRRVL